ncbi:MAG: hypothetical protein ACOVMM_00865 [Chitinophagaceae bacterium]|jgi:hypothetical protein
MSQPHQQTVTEDDVIEYVLRVLFSNLNSNELHLEKDILAATKINFNDHQIEHLRELIISTNFVKNSVGFGKNGYMYLTAFGITQLKVHGTYRNFLKATHGTPHTNIVGNYANYQNEGIESSSQNNLSDNHQHDDMAH